MDARVVGRYLRVTPRKARFVLDNVRGKSVSAALAMLRFVPNEAARYIRKIVESAAANAENNYAMDRDALRITSATVDQGPTLKRIHPRAMGRAFRILKRSSHITVVVSEDESLKKAAAKPKPAKRGLGRRKAAAAAEPKAAAPRKTTKKKVEEPKAAEPVSTLTPPPHGAVTLGPVGASDDKQGQKKRKEG